MERRWEVSLRELKSAKKALTQEEQTVAQYIIPADLLEQLKDIDASLPQLWESGLLTLPQKKSVLRTLIDKVVLHRVSRTVISVRVIWRGGATSGDCITVDAGRATALSRCTELQSAVEQMVKEGIATLSIGPRSEFSRECCHVDGVDPCQNTRGSKSCQGLAEVRMRDVAGHRARQWSRSTRPRCRRPWQRAWIQT